MAIHTGNGVLGGHLAKQQECNIYNGADDGIGDQDACRTALSQ